MGSIAPDRLRTNICLLGLVLGSAAVVACRHGESGSGMVAVAGLALLGHTFRIVRSRQRECERVHRQLLEKAERYRDFLDQANDLIQIIGPDGKLLYVNRAWRETLGYTEKETADLSVFDVICSESLSHCVEMFQRIMAGEVVDRVEAQFRSKDGRVIYVEGSTSCRQEAGQPLNTRGISRDVTERKRAEEALRDSEERLRAALQKEKVAARLDTLTKVANRRAFYEIAEVERGRACRYHRPVSLAYIEVGNFKKVNDRLGHAVGDELLARMAEVLRENIRGSDTVARLGGDEFAVLFPETTVAGVEAALNNLQRVLAAMRASGWPVTFSMGAAVFQSCPRSVHEMILAADELMYTVKNGGKNNFAIAEVDVGAAAQ